MFSLTVIHTIFSFTFYFALLNLVLLFWGQQFLRLLRAQQADDLTLRLVTGLALMVFLALAIFPFIDNYSFFFFLFYIIGLIGSIINIYLNIKKLIVTEKLKSLLFAFLKRDSFLILIFFSIFLSLIHSIIWPSGQIDILGSYNIDYYTWIFYSDCLVGGITPNVIDLAKDLGSLTQDSFGTLVIIGFAACAYLKTPLLASSMIGLTFLIWAAVSIYVLLKKTFSFKPWLSALLTLGVVSGGLFNYLIFSGMFGHVLSLMAFVVSLTQLCHQSDYNWHIKLCDRKIFFPIFLIFISYQGGFILYAAYLIMAGALVAFFQLKKLSFSHRFIKSTLIGTYPVLLATIVSGLLAPGVFAHLLNRSLEVAAQATGWALPFFSFWNFSGLPYYSVEAFKLGDQSIQPVGYYLSYILLIAVTLLSLALVFKLSNHKLIYSKIKAINYNLSTQFGIICSLTLVFLISLIFYLALCGVFDHGYKVWKFATYTCLPLSFIPTALIFKALTIGVKDRCHFFLTFTILFSVIGFKFAGLPSFLEKPLNYYQLSSANELINGLQKIRANLPKSAIILIDSNFYTEKFIISMVLSNNYTSKIYFLKPSIFVKNNNFNLNLINNLLYIISDTKYDNIINNNNNLSSNSIYIYNQERILRQGMVTYKNGPNDFYWQVDLYPIHATILVPHDKIGQNSLLSFDLAPFEDESSPCQKARLGLVGPREITWFDRDINQVWAIAPRDLTKQGIFQAILTIPQDPFSPTPCRFKIKRFNLD